MVFNLIGLIVIGAAAGFLATRMMKLDTDVPTTVLIGIGGALIGGLFLRFVLAILGVAGGLIGAFLGSLVLIWLWSQFSKR